MNRRFSDRLKGLFVGLAVCVSGLVGGCDGWYGVEREGVLARGAEFAPDFVMPAYAAEAFEAAGGQEQWKDTKKLSGEAVVWFYETDGSFYVTQQEYEIYPWSRAIRIRGREPAGGYVWSFSPRGWKVLEGSSEIPGVTERLCGCSVAEFILTITTAPVGLTVSSNEISVCSEPVQVDGLWYDSIERTVAGGTGEGAMVCPAWSQVTYHQSRASRLVDLVWFEPAEGEGFFAVRGYEYRRLANGDVVLPGRIEIFRSDRRGLLQERLVEIELK